MDTVSAFKLEVRADNVAVITIDAPVKNEYPESRVRQQVRG
jgi:hypothetical protein